MVCKYCESQLTGNEETCPVCGALVKREQAAQASQPFSQPGMKRQPANPFPGAQAQARQQAPLVPGGDPLAVPPKKKLSTGAIVGIIIGALVLIAGVVLLIVLLGRDKDTDKDRDDGWKQVMEQALQAEKTVDYQKEYNLMTLAERNLLLKQMGISKEQFEQQLADSSEQAKEAMQNSPEYAAYYSSLQYTVKSSRSLTESELEEVNEHFASICGYEDYVSEAVLAVITSSYTYNGVKSEEDLTDLFVKVNGKWYICFDVASYSFMQNTY